MQRHAIAIIPARGGSKRVPRKNLLRIGGLPLIAHSIRHAHRAHAIETVYVSTDDPEIAEVGREYGAEVIARPASLATDDATSEVAITHALDHLKEEGHDDPDLVVFLQATSPVRSPGDIDQAVAQLYEEGADSVFSAVRDHGLLWEEVDGDLYPLNWSLDRRPRSQTIKNRWRENGSIYVFKPAVLRESGNRLGGRIAVYPMGYWSAFELDLPEDATLIEWILSSAQRPASEWPDQISLVVFDFDGVMTDNSARVGVGGVELVSVSRADGMGVARLREAGVQMVVLSTETHPVVSDRCIKLGLECRQGIADKGRALEALLEERGIPAAEVAYVGNDVNDLDCFEMVGLPVAVADADPTLHVRAAHVLSRRGGHGAVREFCDLVLVHREERAGVA